jgi:catalase
VLWDGVVVPDGEQAVRVLSQSGHALEFLKDQYRHCKPILLFGSAQSLMEKAGLPAVLDSEAVDAGLMMADSGHPEAAVATFVNALTQHRFFDREVDPPRV